MFALLLKAFKCNIVVFKRELWDFAYGETKITSANLFSGSRCCWKYQKGPDESLQGHFEVIIPRSNEPENIKFM